jgi:hypothetical protein
MSSCTPPNAIETYETRLETGYCEVNKRASDRPATFVRVVLLFFNVKGAQNKSNSYAAVISIALLDETHFNLKAQPHLLTSPRHLLLLIYISPAILNCLRPSEPYPISNIE